MQKLILTIVTVLFSINFYSQDTIDVPNKAIEPLLKIHTQLNEPVKPFPLIKSDSLNFLSFEKLKSLALELEKKLELIFIEYYSESGQEWNKKHFKNLFKVKGKIEDHSILDHYHLNLEVDTLKSQTILSSEPNFEPGINLGSYSDIISLSRKVIPKKNDSINPHGILQVKIKYLVGYDTINLNKNKFGKEFKIANDQYRFEGLLNGNIFIKSLNSTNDLEILENSRFIAYKDQRIVHLPQQNSFPLDYSERLKILSVLLNDSLIQIPKDNYRKYLKNLKFERSKQFFDLLILDTKVDFDNIQILIPKYDYLNKKLKGRIEKKNVDNIKIVRHSFSIQDYNKEDHSIDD